MKRPSEVPPVVDSSASMPVTSRMAVSAASTSVPLPVRKGLAPSVQAISKSRPCRSRISTTLALRLSGVLAVAKRKLNWISTWPGITLLAPVPP